MLLPHLSKFQIERKIKMMKIDKYLPMRAYLKLLRKFDSTKNNDVKILTGPLKGYRWNVRSNTNGFFTGKYEAEFVELLMGKLKPTDVFYDIGANAGYFSIIASTVIKEENSIVAFEPVPYLHKIIQHHASVNGVKNVDVFPYAISNKTGTVQFSNMDKTGGNTYISESSIFKNSDTLEVKSTSLDDFLANNKQYKIPTILKIDAEGAEFDVLQGARKTLKDHKPLLFLSTHDIHLPGVKDKCLNFLRDLGYTIEQKVEDSKDKKPGLDDFIAY